MTQRAKYDTIISILQENSNMNREDMAKYIRKNAAVKKENKMLRNMQPEIEKIKSLQSSVRGHYINDSEASRMLHEIETLIQCIKAANMNQ